MRNTKIGTITLAYMQERGLQAVAWGDQILDELALLTGGRRAKQKDRWNHILDALERDDRFKKIMFPIRVNIPSQHRDLPIMVRRFEICNNDDNDFSIEEFDDEY